MKMPEGYKECIQDNNDEKALKLDKAIYQLAQIYRVQISAGSHPVEGSVRCMVTDRKFGW